MFAAQTAAQDAGQVFGGFLGILPCAQSTVKVLGRGVGLGMGAERQAAVPHLLGSPSKQPPPSRAVQGRQSLGKSLSPQKDTASPGQRQGLLGNGRLPAQTGSLGAEGG